MQFLGIAILSIFSLAPAYAQQSDSLEPSITDYYKFDGPADFEFYKPLTDARDFLKILENRKLVDIDTKAQYIFLYKVGTNRGTTKIDGRILMADRFKKDIVNGINLSDYRCVYGICSKPDSTCGPEDKYYGYEGGIVVWVNSCGNMTMQLSLSKDRQAYTPHAPKSESEKPIDTPVAPEGDPNNRFD